MTLYTSFLTPSLAFKTASQKRTITWRYRSGTIRSGSSSIPTVWLHRTVLSNLCLIIQIYCTTLCTIRFCFCHAIMQTTLWFLFGSTRLDSPKFGLVEFVYELFGLLWPISHPVMVRFSKSLLIYNFQQLQRCGRVWVQILEAQVQE